MREVDIGYRDETPIEIKEDGVYVITGGLNGIGLEIARSFATGKKVNLALISRSQIPARDEWEEIIKENENKKL